MVSDAGDIICILSVFYCRRNYHIARNGILPLRRHRNGSAVGVDGILESLAFVLIRKLIARCGICKRRGGQKCGHHTESQHRADKAQKTLFMHKFPLFPKNIR